MSMQYGVSEVLFLFFELTANTAGLGKKRTLKNSLDLFYGAHIPIQNTITHKYYIGINARLFSLSFHCFVCHLCF